VGTGGGWPGARNEVKQEPADGGRPLDGSRARVDSSRTGADNSRKRADNSRTGADSSRKPADNGRARVDSSRTGADNSRKRADNSRAGADSSRAGYWHPKLAHVSPPMSAMHVGVPLQSQHASSPGHDGIVPHAPPVPVSDRQYESTAALAEVQSLQLAHV
jgi:hypothetical protein